MEELRTYLGELFKQNDGEILTVDHPRYREFRSRMANHLNGWTSCPHDYRYSRQALEEMDSGFDVAGTLAYYRDRGGYCDCEILLNVAPEDMSWQ